MNQEILQNKRADYRKRIVSTQLKSQYGRNFQLRIEDGCCNLQNNSTRITADQVKLLEMHKDGIMVAEYWTELPPKEI